MSRMGCCYLVLVLALVSSFANGTNILCLMSVASYSHHIWNRVLMEALAEKGYNLTIVSADVEKVPKVNMTYIHLEETYHAVHEGDSSIDLYEMAQEGLVKSMLTFYDYGIASCGGSLRSKGLEQILNYPNDFKFDLVLYDFTLGPCILGLHHKFGQPPLVGVSAFSIPPYTDDLIGGHKYPAYIPYYTLNYGTDMTFLQRLENAFIYAADYFYRNYVFLPATDKQIRQNPFFKDMPYVGSLQEKTMLVMVNSHHSVDYPEPIPQNMVLVGGLQIMTPKPLPEDIKKFMDSGRKGAILFSLGTNVLSSDLGDERIAMFMEAIRHFPDYNFLWKFEADLKNRRVPKNLMVKKFLPQNDILAHPNTKLFITHAGLLSTQEATWHGVPMVGIPFIADQYRNLEKSIQAGVAERLVIWTVTTEKIVATVRKVLQDDGYRVRMKQKSALFRDQPEMPLERALWWIDWCLRHPNAESIRSPTVRLGPWKSELYDVKAFLVLVVILMVIGIRKLFQGIFSGSTVETGSQLMRLLVTVPFSQILTVRQRGHTQSVAGDMRKVFCAVLFTVLIANTAFGANILCLFGVASPSHHIWNRAIIDALAAKGHNVTIISADIEENTENVHYIELEETYAELYSGPHNVDLMEMANENLFKSVVSFYRDFVMTECRGNLKSKGMAFIKNYPDDFKFDLVLYDMTCGGCMHGLLHKFKYPPLVSVTPFNNPPYVTDVIGGHKFYAYTPFYSLSYGTDMTFFERVHNTLLYTVDFVYRTYYSNPLLDKMVREYFQYDDLPYVPDLDRLSRVLLVNAHYSIDFPEPVPPNLIPVGGLQIMDPKPVPKDLEQFISDGRKGAVLFSLGTNIRSDELGKDRQLMLIEAMRQLPDYNFLWKFESDLDLKLPKNVIIRKWLPQNDILAHPKVKGFVTHAGLLSVHEASWYGVPMIGIPFIADQHRNIEKCIRLGVAERIVFQTLSTEQVRDTIRKVLETPSYRKNMDRISALFRDQPEKPLTRAVWWIEWALRHPDVDSLQSPVLKLGFLRSNLVDVIAFLVLVPCVLVLVVKKMVCKGRRVDQSKKNN